MELDKNTCEPAEVDVLIGDAASEAGAWLGTKISSKTCELMVPPTFHGQHKELQFLLAHAWCGRPVSSGAVEIVNPILCVLCVLCASVVKLY